MDSSYGRRVAEFLGAILAGNAVYFFLLVPRLPAAWGHQPYCVRPRVDTRLFSVRGRLHRVALAATPV